MASDEATALAGTVDAPLGGGGGPAAGGAVRAVIGCRVWKGDRHDGYGAARR